MVTKISNSSSAQQVQDSSSVPVQPTAQQLSCIQRMGQAVRGAFQWIGAHRKAILFVAGTLIAAGAGVYALQQQNQPYNPMRSPIDSLPDGGEKLRSQVASLCNHALFQKRAGLNETVVSPIWAGFRSRGEVDCLVTLSQERCESIGFTPTVLTKQFYTKTNFNEIPQEFHDPLAQHLGSALKDGTFFLKTTVDCR